MSKEVLREKVIRLRRAGHTYSEIKKSLRLEIPKSTISNWCNGIIMPKSYNKKLAELNKFSRAKALKVLSEKRIRENTLFFKNTERQNHYLLDKISHDNAVKKIILAILYLGEGSKWKSHRGLMLGSSDPGIIKLYIRLLSEIYSVPVLSLRARVLYRADQNLDELTKFWSKITGLPKEYFYKTKFDSRTIGKPTKNKNYKGVCVVSCAGTKIQLELEIIAKMICGGPLA